MIGHHVAKQRAEHRRELLATFDQWCRDQRDRVQQSTEAAFRRLRTIRTGDALDLPRDCYHVITQR